MTAPSQESIVRCGLFKVVLFEMAFLVVESSPVASIVCTEEILELYCFLQGVTFLAAITAVFSSGESAAHFSGV